MYRFRITTARASLNSPLASGSPGAHTMEEDQLLGFYIQHQLNDNVIDTKEDIGDTKRDLMHYQVSPCANTYSTMSAEFQLDCQS